MFIQRLQKNDIANFLKRRYNVEKLSIFLEHKFTNIPYIYLIIKEKDRKIDGRLYDFESFNIAGNWQNFLYNKFGTEYYTEYQKYLEKDVIRKIKKMLKE